MFRNKSESNHKMEESDPESKIHQGGIRCFLNRPNHRWDYVIVSVNKECQIDDTDDKFVICETQLALGSLKNIDIFKSFYSRQNIQLELNQNNKYFGQTPVRFKPQLCHQRKEDSKFLDCLERIPTEKQGFQIIIQKTISKADYMSTIRRKILNVSLVRYFLYDVAFLIALNYLKNPGFKERYGSAKRLKMGDFAILQGKKQKDRYEKDPDSVEKQIDSYNIENLWKNQQCGLVFNLANEI